MSRVVKQNIHGVTKQLKPRESKEWKWNYTSQQKKRYKDVFEIYFYVKAKTIVYYHLRQCLHDMRLSSQNKQ